MPEVKRPRVVDTKDPRFFSLKTAQVRAFKTASQEGEKYFIEGIASSTVMDSYGDVLTEACQISMLEQCKEMTAWLNHSYQVPEDILGTIVEATLVRGTAGDGTGRDDEGEGDCVDLYIKVEIDPANPRAMKIWTHITNGTKLAFSIGGWFRDVEIVENDSDWGWGFLVNGIELLEISCVGLPANPRAYTKALEALTDSMRAYVVERAQEIAKSAAAETPLRDHAQFVCKAMFSARASSDDEPANLDEPVGASTAGEPADGAAPASAAAPDSATAVGTAAIADDHPVEPRTPLNADDVRAIGRDAAVDALKKLQDEIGDRDGNGVRLALQVGIDAILATGVDLDVRELSDLQTQGCLSAMTFIKSALAHGMCTEAATDTRSAHAIVKAMLPNDYDIPDDAELDDTLDVGVDVHALQAQLADLQAQLDASRTAAQGLQAQLDAGKTELEQVSAQRDALTQQVDQLKATPAGRSTRSSYPGGSSTNEPTADASLYYRTQSELAATAARSSAPGAARDARARMQV